MEEPITPSEQLSIHAQALVRAAKTGKLKWIHVVRGCSGIWRAVTRHGKQQQHAHS